MQTLGKKAAIGALGLLLLAGAMLVQRTYDGKYLSSEQSVRELLYFPSSRVIKLLSAGNELMVADFLWLRMIQYYAFHMRTDRNYEYLFPITDRITDLDPRFVYPYTFGALLLAHDASDSVGSIRLLDKAKRNNPDRWEFPYMKGFILYVFFRRSEEAVAEFLEASRLPNAWNGALRYAAFISRREGRDDVSKMMWRDIYNNTKNEVERGIALTYLRKFEIEEKLTELQSMAQQYRQQFGAWPNDLSDLAAAGYSGPVGADSLGGRYYWDPSTQRVRNTTYDRYSKFLKKKK